jgi:tRNA A37 threonylcarbamoyladenosine modification protein TsaB
LHKPVTSISVLEAVAIASNQQGRVVAALDAQRNEVFAGEYSIAHVNGGFQLHTENEALSTVNEFCAWLKVQIPIPTTFTPDAAIAERVTKSGSPAEVIFRPAADLYARIGWSKFAAGQIITADALDANYIRRSDAEIFSKK